MSLKIKYSSVFNDEFEKKPKNFLKLFSQIWPPLNRSWDLLDNKEKSQFLGAIKVDR